MDFVKDLFHATLTKPKQSTHHHQHAVDSRYVLCSCSLCFVSICQETHLLASCFLRFIGSSPSTQDNSDDDVVVVDDMMESEPEIIDLCSSSSEGEGLEGEEEEEADQEGEEEEVLVVVAVTSRRHRQAVPSLRVRAARRSAPTRSVSELYSYSSDSSHHSSSADSDSTRGIDEKFSDFLLNRPEQGIERDSSSEEEDE